MKVFFARGTTAPKAGFYRLSLRLSLIALFALAIAFLPGAAHADSFDTYTLSGTFYSGGTLSGTITFDWNGSSAVVKSGTVVADGHTYTCSAANPCAVQNNHSTSYIDISLGHSSDILLAFGTINFAHPPYSFSLSSATECSHCSSRYSYDYLASGKATDPPPPVNPTPEPPAVLLFGAGLIGIGALATSRRKNAVASPSTIA